MCGIAGLVYEYNSGAAAKDWPALEEAVQRLLKHTPNWADPQPVFPLLGAVEEHLSDIREWPILSQLWNNPSRQEQLNQAAVELERWDQDLQKATTSADLSLSIALLETWNAISVRIRDIGWTLQQDALGGLRRCAQLLPHAWRDNAKACFESWKLTVTLENIGRMEVRGRDSLGFSVMVSFPDRASFGAWRDKLSESQSQQLHHRLQGVELIDQAIVVDEASVIFVYKVAQEVGALGDNVAQILGQMKKDELLWMALAPETSRVNVFSHTRWASNGIISEPNCHPISELTLKQNGKASQHGAPSPHRIMVCLNGDVDNYQELCARIQSETGRTIPAKVTTDTKIIPVLVDYHFDRTKSMREAFCRTVSQCEGSIAVIMHNSLEPGRIYLALRGSGQALFVGLCRYGYVFASELYGVVEQTQRFFRMDGTTERVPGKPESAGQVLILEANGQGALEAIEAWSFDGERIETNGLKTQSAEITTRDINRGTFTHYLLKEINEAPESIRKTLRGKFHLDANTRQARMNLDEKVLPLEALERLRQGKVRRLLFIGQGTAAVAGQAVSAIAHRILGSKLNVQAMKATELSGYSMEENLEDSLVVAISQSGTTTDTNRTVDMAKNHGATVLAIVNRRNSDLVYKVDGVLYTSDGRDIEMSVASTKAFYSQVVAGYLVTYHLAMALGLMDPAQAYGELSELLRLPDLMKSVLADPDKIREFAEHWAPVRRDWAIVGSGPTRAAADEIRIKLSELCYKSIATDFIEDKKHIDLSSEPLTLVCAAGLPLMALKDAVKEVAIFKSHKSVPIVITTEGFTAFEPYAAGVLYVPKTSEAASVLLNTLVGHLWGYYCAQAIDRGAEQLRHARALAVQVLTESESIQLSPSLLRQVRDLGRRFQDELWRGRFNSSLSLEVGSKLGGLFQYFTGASSLRQFAAEFQAPPTAVGVAEVLIQSLSQAIAELSRPIDAIKHQAKTVTVGISRLEEAYEGPLFEALSQLAIEPDSIPYADLVTLRVVSQAVKEVSGITCYQVDGLGTMGEVTAASTVKVISKLGRAAAMRSRADKSHALVGTKEWCVRRGSTYIGRGRKDQCPIMIVPSAPRGQVERLALLHLDLHRQLGVEQKVSLLRDLSGRYEDIKSQVLETDSEWSDQVLEGFSPADLILMPVEQLTERVLAYFLKAQEAKV
ncbi:SIS domain-containing protein [bacterium]|nr:SIS domain-containing protein [bacterium]